MRVNYMHPTREEIGDPFAKLAQVIAFRRQQKIAKPVTKPVVKVLAPAVVIRSVEPHPAINRQEVVDGNKTPYSSHAYLPPGGDWHQRQREKWNSEQPPQYVSVAQCIAYISQSENVSRMDIVGPWRQRHIAEARQRAMWLSRQYGDPETCSFPAIGRRFGGRDHTTVLHGWNKINARVKAGEWVPPTIEQVAAVARNAGVV